MIRGVSLFLTLLLCACGPSSGGGGGGDGDGGTGGNGDGGGGGGSCTPGQGACSGNTHYVCGADGNSRTNELVCPDSCDPALGCVFCVAGARQCNGDVSQVCSADGQSWVSGRDCNEWGSTCGSDGFCNDGCAEAERSKSNVGCEYWPVPLANTGELNSALFDYRVVIANPNATVATARVTRGATEVWTGTIDGGSLVEVSLPWIANQSFNISEGSWSSFVTADGAYRLTSDIPVIASQFNPFEYNVDGTFSYTNDATLLYPSHVLTGDYAGVSYAPLSRRTGTEGGLTGGSFNTIRYPGYIAVVGLSPEPTSVTVSAAAQVAADASGRWPATATGASFTFTLARGEVAHITAAVPPECGAGRPGFVEERDCQTIPIIGEQCDIFQTCYETDYDLTGTRIAANRPVSVFGGHTCAYIPTSAQACDHLEVQLPPIQSWGKSFVSAPMGDGAIGGVNVVRVMPAFGSTTITVEPAQGGVSGGTVAAGGFLEFNATTPFAVTGSNAILVSQYLRGQQASSPAAARGDPAMTVLVPAEQYRNDYTFILPSSYNASTNGQNHVLVVRPPGLAITLDGAAMTATWQTVGGSEIGVVPLDGGTHTVSAAEPFGLIAYGLGTYTSYATPAGLDFKPITVLAPAPR